MRPISEPQATPTLRSIQHLRAAAALSVVAYHTMQWRADAFEIGRAGVDVFFVISGVIMWTVTAGRPVTPGGFLIRRFTRVAPTYWVATLAAVALAALWPGLLTQVLPGAAHLALSLAFLPHLDPLGLPFPTLPPGWSLIYEAIFYLTFAAALLAPERRRAMVVTAALMAIVVAGFLLADPVWILGANPMLLQFAAGVWLGRALRAGRLPSRPWGYALVSLGLGLVAATALPGMFSEVWRPLLWGVPALMIVAGALSLERRGRSAAPGVLTSLGDASLSIYLFHLPVVAVVARLAPAWPAWVLLAPALTASAAVGVFARVTIEKPLLRLSRRSIASMDSIDWTGRRAGPRTVALGPDRAGPLRSHP